MAGRQIMTLIAGSAFALSAMASTPVLAHHSGGYDNYPAEYGNYGRNDRRYDDRGYDNRRYDQQGNGWQNAQGQRCSKGTTGLILGAVAGGLLGRAVVGRRGDRTAGVIVGAGAGALAGRAVDRSGNRRC